MTDHDDLLTQLDAVATLKAQASPLVRSLCAEAAVAVRAMSDRAELAESETWLWRNRFEAAETLIRDHDCDDCNDSLSDLLATPDRPGGTDNPTSDEPRTDYFIGGGGDG